LGGRMRVQCSTCLELLTPEDDLTCTPCGHVFHLACVVQWFENKKNCPQCRHTANERTLRKIFLADTEDQSGGVDAGTLQAQLDSAQFQARMKESEKTKLVERNSELERLLTRQKEEIKKLESSRRAVGEKYEGVKSQNRFLMEEKARYNDAVGEAAALRNKLDNLRMVETAVRSEEGEINKMLHERGAFDGRTRDLATLIVMLKQKLADVKKERNQHDNKVKELSRERLASRRAEESLKTKLAEAQTELEACKREVWRLQEDNRHWREQAELRDQQPDRLVIAEDEEEEELVPLPASQSQSSTTQSPPSPPQYRVPSFTKAGVGKRPRSPESGGSPRSPLMPLLNHTSKRLAGPARSSHQSFDGLGGRARQDLFPSKSFSSQSIRHSRPISKPSKPKPVVATINRQSKTIDKFFGSFDTP